MSPDEFRRDQETKIPANANPKKGLVRDDLKSFCKERMGESWHKAYIPNERLAMQVMRAGSTSKERDKAIRDLIAEQNDPIVRHRLSVFAARLHELAKSLRRSSRNSKRPATSRWNLSETICRKVFLGQQAQMDYGAWARARKREAKDALDIVKQLGCKSRDAVSKICFSAHRDFSVCIPQRRFERG